MPLGKIFLMLLDNAELQKPLDEHTFGFTFLGLRWLSSLSLHKAYNLVGSLTRNVKPSFL